MDFGNTSSKELIDELQRREPSNMVRRVQSGDSVTVTIESAGKANIILDVNGPATLLVLKHRERSQTVAE